MDDKMKKVWEFPLAGFEYFDELENFCDFFGFNIEHDNQGQIVIYTGLISDDGISLREMTNDDLTLVKKK